MDCRKFEARLEAWLEGRLSAAERLEAERHLGLCPACRDLAALAELSGTPSGEEAPAAPRDLLASVLARTGGSPCARAETLLGARPDDGLEASDRELLELHLAGCAECRALERTLEALAVELPRLAAIHPGEGFVAAVLAATLPARVRLRRRATGVLSRWAWRPRFASEVAYVATLILVLVVTLPGSPLAAARGGAPDLEMVQKVIRLDEPVQALERRVGAGVRTLRQTAASTAAALLRGAADRAVDGSRELLAAARSEMETFWKRAASLLVTSDEPAASGPNEPTEETS